MSAGLDSLAATDFTNLLSDRLDVEVAPLMLFDHPTLRSITSFLQGEVQLSRRQAVGIYSTKIKCSHLVAPQTESQGSEFEAVRYIDVISM